MKCNTFMHLALSLSIVAATSVQVGHTIAVVAAVGVALSSSTAL